MKANEERGEAVDKAKFPWVGLVRLIAAVAGSLVTSFFFVAYNKFSLERLKIQDGEAPVSALSSELISLGEWVYAFPIAALILGTMVLWVRPKNVVILEVVVSIVWVASLLMVTLPILSWLIQPLVIRF